MAKRRPSGDGMVRKREDGRWEGRIVVGHKKNGTPIFQHAYAHTQKELTEKLHQNIERYQDVELTEDSRMTLGEWLDRWLTDYKENTVRPGTLAGYRSCIENYIKPQLGGKQVSLVTSQDVQKLYRKLKENGRVREHPRFGSALSDTTINRLHAIFHQAIDRPITFHMFRHSYATWAKSNGVEPFVIKSWMGHSMKGNITEDVYTSVTKEMADTAVGIMDAFLAELIAEAKKLGTIEEPNGRNGKKRKA